jgi:hypothetical protein
MTHDEALAILPPDVAAQVAAQAAEGELSGEQLDTLSRLFAAAPAQAGGVAQPDPLDRTA